MSVEILPVRGLPEVRPGHNLAELIAATGVDLADGDVVVVTQKIVSKAEGRLVATPTDEAGREATRQRAVAEEAVRIVARRGRTVITETRHGFVLAASGVDASNVQRNEIALLPVDPDRSAAVIRSGLLDRFKVNVAVVVSDTFGRPWRKGLTDVAIGAAGISAIRDHRGQTDVHGNTLAMTEVAVIDEVAAAAELVMGKMDGIPVAIVRGLRYEPGNKGVRPLVRAADDDLFRLGTDEARRSAVTARHPVHTFLPNPVNELILERAAAAAVRTPAPNRTAPWRIVVVYDPDRRKRLLNAMHEAWGSDLRRDGLDESAIAQHLRRANPLQQAPCLVVPCILPTGAHPHSDDWHLQSEREMSLVYMGAGLENLLVALAAEGYGSSWVGSMPRCQAVVQKVLELPLDWEPVGAVAVGRPAGPSRDARTGVSDEFVLRR